jgi:M-phase inducer tyrosine phosphatase
MMDASSPLAAMQPQSYMGHMGFNHADVPSSYGVLASAKKFSANFNFRDLSMNQLEPIKRSNSDYFSLKPVRGSSPTASLAADLSQNFHIDQRYEMSRTSAVMY